MPSPFQSYLPRIQSLTIDTPAKWGKMNAHEMICHCTDQVRAALGEKESKDISTFFSRTVIKALALGPVPIPRGKAKTAPEFDQKIGGTAPREFEADRQVLLDYLHQFEQYRETLSPHPLFRNLSRSQWQKMITKHLDHHLAQFGV